MNEIRRMLLAAGTEGIKAGLTEARDGVTDIGKFLINVIAIPLAAIVLLGIMVFLIVKLVEIHKNHGNDKNEKIVEIICCIVALVLLTSFPAWGWKMIDSLSGGGGNSSGATAVVQQITEFV